jgi:pectate lyase
MKLVRFLLLMTAIAFVCLSISGKLSALIAAHAQSGTTQGTRGRTDPVQRELQRRFESDAIERALAQGPRAANNERRLILVQIKEDFLRLQIVDDGLRQATRVGPLDLEAVAKSVSEIASRAKRLKDNLALPELETTPDTPDSDPETSIEQLRLSLAVLSNSIKEFVENPVFEKAGVVDAKLSAKARRDLEQIIAVSKQAKRAGEKLLRARPQAAPSGFAKSSASSASLVSLASPARSGQSRGLPAFPGAEGFGSTTPGGRGGRVIFVTNLDDAGAGSFRAACEAEGPRIVIFRVSGLITLAKPIVVKSPYITIAGQTAPGDGICLRSHTFIIATHDVVVRYLRSRLGDLSGQEADSITLASGAENVILDHCSASWSVDEALSLAGNVSQVTVQWCLIAEGLNRSKHAKGAHGYGSLSRANGPVTWHHNLWAHNNSRNPRLGDNYGRPPYPTFDVRNNVIYDYGEIASGLTQGVLKVNYVANYIRPGPDSKAATPIRVGAPSDLSFYIRGNVFEGNPALTADNSQFFDPVMIDGKRQVRTVAEPFGAAPVKTVSAERAFEAVLREVGASRPRRDSVDARIVDQVRRRRGSIIDSQEQMGGWPNLSSKTAPVDSDDDGLPDAWERRQGLNPRDAADGAADKDGDGYTNLEEYLNSI